MFSVFFKGNFPAAGELTAGSLIHPTWKPAQCILLIDDPPRCFGDLTLTSLFRNGYRGRAASSILLHKLSNLDEGPNVLDLLKFYWNNQPCVVKCEKYHREIFVPHRGVTQGGVVFPTLFNVLVDAVVRK